MSACIRNQAQVVAEILMRLVVSHQHRNAATAATAALVLRREGFDRVGVPAIMQGLAEAHLPGRFQVQPAAVQFCAALE